VRVPIDAKTTVLGDARWLGLPTVVVARPGLGTINHTILTVEVVTRRRGVSVAGVVINRYPAESASVAEETNARAIERWGKVSVLCTVPEEPIVNGALGPGIMAAIATVDWTKFLSTN
jgi:dethiobiotin synthetase